MSYATPARPSPPEPLLAILLPLFDTSCTSSCALLRLTTEGLPAGANGSTNRGTCSGCTAATDTIPDNPAAPVPFSTAALSINVGGVVFTVRRAVLVQPVPLWEPPPSAPSPESPPSKPNDGPLRRPASPSAPLTPETRITDRVSPATSDTPAAVAPGPVGPQAAVGTGGTGTAATLAAAAAACGVGIQVAATGASWSGAGCWPTQGSVRQVQTMLSAMFSGRWEAGLPRDEAGRPFLEFDPTCFRQMLNWLVALHRLREVLLAAPGEGGGVGEREEQRELQAGEGGGQGEEEGGAELGPAVGQEANQTPLEPARSAHASPRSAADAAAAAAVPAVAAGADDPDAVALLRGLAAVGLPRAPPPPYDPRLLGYHLDMLRYLGMPLPYIPLAPPPPPPPPLTCRMGSSDFTVPIDRPVVVHGCMRACLIRTQGRSREGEALGRVCFQLQGHPEVVGGSGGVWILAPFRIVPHLVLHLDRVAATGRNTGLWGPMGVEELEGLHGRGQAVWRGDAAVSSDVRGEGEVGCRCCWRCGAPPHQERRGQHGADEQEPGAGDSLGLRSPKPPQALAPDTHPTGDGRATSTILAPEATPAAAAVPPGGSGAGATSAGRYVVCKMRLSAGAAVGVLLGPLAKVAARCAKYGVMSPVGHGAFYGWDDAAQADGAATGSAVAAAAAAAARGVDAAAVAAALLAQTGVVGARGRAAPGRGADQGPHVASVGSPRLGGSDGASGGSAVHVGQSSLLPSPSGTSAAVVRGGLPPLPLFPPISPSLYDTDQDIILGMDALTSRLSLYSWAHFRLLHTALPDECTEGAVAVFLRGAGARVTVSGEAEVSVADCRAVRVEDRRA